MGGVGGVLGRGCGRAAALPPLLPVGGRLGRPWAALESAAAPLHGVWFGGVPRGLGVPYVRRDGARRWLWKEMETMKDPVIESIEQLMEMAAKKAAAAGEAADKVEEARQLGLFLGLSMAKAIYTASIGGAAPAGGV